MMNTCEGCYFWHPEKPGDKAAPCWAGPPQIIPLHGQGGLIMQMMQPTTPNDFYCHFHDPRPRPMIKVTSQMPGKN